MENKLCRICWNSSGWRHPTGEARELESGSWVSEHGYGGEEWLFNYEWMLDGYKYGSLQPIGKYQSYAGQTSDLCLYTISPTGQILIVGTIKNAYIPRADEAQAIFERMKRKGWISQMIQDCEAIGAGPFEDNYLGQGGVINVRFKPVDVDLFDPMIPADPEHKVSNVPARYHPYNWDGELPIGKSKIKPSNLKRSEHARDRAAQKSCTYDPTHIKLQNHVFDILQERYGLENVFYEKNNVDLTIKQKDKLVLIEIKTANTAKRCIREALGQLFEYAFYGGAQGNNEIVVLADCPFTAQDQRYLDFLQKRFKIPIRYWKFDWESKSIEGLGL